MSEGAVDFEGIRFRYDDAAEGDYVFRDLTLTVPAGQRVGLVGRSGSGVFSQVSLSEMCKHFFRV